MQQRIPHGTPVTFQYRQHPLLGGALVHGEGVVIGDTIVGTEDAYIVRPTSGDVVHVHCAGVRRDEAALERAVDALAAEFTARGHYEGALATIAHRYGIGRDTLDAAYDRASRTHAADCGYDF